MKSCLVIRADASPTVGTGHVMRCLALTLAACKRGLSIRLVGRTAVPWVRRKLSQVAVAFVAVAGDIPTTENPENLLAQLGHNEGETWVVLDGYHFSLDCQKAVRDAGYKLLVIDDYAHLSEYCCDILLNQNIGAENLPYRGEINQRLLGSRYSLLRPEFLAARYCATKRRLSENVQNILLTLGGGDGSEQLARLAPDFAIPELAGRTLRVIAGAMLPERVRSLLKDCPAKVEILDRVDDMAKFMLEIDLSITAGGSTYGELCCLGVPFLTLEVAENQHNIIHDLQKIGVAPIYSQAILVALLQDGAARREYADAGSALVDGQGAERVITAMTE